MLKVDNIRDFGTLKQAAQLLEGTVSKLQNQVILDETRCFMKINDIISKLVGFDTNVKQIQV